MLPLSYGLQIVHFLENIDFLETRRRRPQHQQHEQQNAEHQMQLQKEETEAAQTNPSVIDVNETQPMELAFKGISKSCPEKKILSDVSGTAKPGEVLALMGPSGSGKTTLLNILSGRIPPDSGVITLNGKPLNKRLRRKICYVLQEDILLPHLTLRQTLKFSALLRLPDVMSYTEKIDFMERMIDILDLRHCLNTIVGDITKRGLSGGERKRLNIGCELLSNPTMMVLDEPTTGLDSCTAYTLMAMLKRYAAEEKKTVVVTIHQPSSQIFHMFNSIILLAEGQVAYAGSKTDVIGFFESLDLIMPPYYNPADFLMEQLKKGSETLKKILMAAKKLHDHETPEEKQKCNMCSYVILPSQADNFKNGNVQVTIDSNPETPSDIDLAHVHDQLPCTCSWFQRRTLCPRCSQNLDYGPRWPTSFWVQLKVLTQRNFIECRKRLLCQMNWIQTIAIAIICGLIWFQANGEEVSLSDMKGWIFFSCSYWMLFALFEALLS